MSNITWVIWTYSPGQPVPQNVLSCMKGAYERGVDKDLTVKRLFVQAHYVRQGLNVHFSTTTLELMLGINVRVLREQAKWNQATNGNEEPHNFTRDTDDS